MNDNFINLIQKRRSIYALSNKLPLPRQELIQKISAVLKDMPSAFNVQSARIALLLDEHHQKFWNLVLETLKSKISADKLPATTQKIESFAAAYGTILFFEDTAPTQKLKETYPTYATNFDTWAEQGNAMLEFALWTLFAEQNIGASLQHYNPLIDKSVRDEWNLSSSWRLIAQMPFGGVQSAPKPKTYLPLSERLKIFATNAS